MVSLSVSQLEQLLSNPNKIRNVLVVCDRPSNNSFLDRLISTAAITIQPEDEKSNEPKLEETIYTSLYYECKSESASYLTNLLYSPDCKHLPSEIISNMRLADGALLVIDYIQGVSTIIESMLRLVASDHMKQILVINNIYRALSKFEQDPELIYQNLAEIVDLVNIFRSSYTQLSDQANVKLKPENGNVAFEFGPTGSWMFTINKFSSIYSKKFNISVEKLNEKFWGNHYFDPKTEKWTTQQISEDSRTLCRGFVEFILKPIIKLTKILINSNEGQLEKALAKIQVTLSPEERKLEGVNLVENVLSKWINSSDNLFEMIIAHLPSPKEAQAQRINSLYEGQDIDYAIGIKECNPESPLMIYVSRLVSISDKGRFFAIGRVFSGTVFTGQKVRIMGPNYKPGKKDDLAIKNIQRVVFIAGRSVKSFNHVPCGTIIGLVGIDPYIIKNATISDSETAQIIKPLKYQMPQVIRVAVEPKAPEDLPKLIEGLRSLVKSDPLAFIPYQETGEHVITGVDDSHLEICLDNLQSKFARCETRASNRYVNYRETVTEASPICLAKSANKHCRFYCTAKSLSESLADAIERGEIGPMCDNKQQARILYEEFGWEKFDAQRIWTFGPENSGPNIFVDMTKGIQFLNEIRDSTESAFQWVTKEGVLCEEPWRKVRIDLIDTTMMTDAIHRGGGQVIPAIRRVCYACELTASPRLLEPIFMREIITQSDNLGSLYNDLNYKRGYVLEEEHVKGTDLIRVRFYLPNAESLSFDSSFKLYSPEYIPCGGIFNHWDTVPGNPLDTNSAAYNIMAQIRKIKGLKEGIPPLDNYMDRL